MFRISSFSNFYPLERTCSCFFSSLTLFLLVFILRLGLDLVSGHSYKLVLDSVNSPPAVIPTDKKKLIYSVPLNQLTSRPIIAYIQDKTGNIVNSLNDSIKAYVTSMDKFQKKIADLDKWRDSGGKLCQWSNPDQDWPSRLNRGLYHTVCGSSLRTTTLIAKIFKGKIIMDWLKHVHASGVLPANDRFIRIEIPALNIFKDTSLFKITEPAASLTITKEPNKYVFGNTDFDIEAEIHDRNGTLVTDGLDSVAFVDLTIMYDLKIFYHKPGKKMLIKSTKARLGGPSVSVYQSTKDRIIRRRAVAGKVSFTDVRILEPFYDLRLNLTMLMSKDPYLRIPNCEKCYSDLSYKTIINDEFVQFHTPPESVLKEIPSMKFTKNITILSQIYRQLELISNKMGSGKMQITRNFPIPGPIRILIKDAFGNKIHAGFDSHMPLEVITTPSDLCLSSDYTIITKEGIATFFGSICDIRESAFLTFYSKKLPTVNVTSQEFEIVGQVNIAHFDHFEFTGAGIDISPHINSFVRFAASDINSGVIPGILRPFNMKLTIVTVETKNDLSNTILQYRWMRELALKFPSNTIRAALLSGNQKISFAMIRELFNRGVTQISLDEKGEKYADFPLFNRVCWNSRQIYSSFLKYCKERHWTHIVVIKTPTVHISRSLRRYARFLQIELTEIMIDPTKVQWKSDDPDVNNILSDAMETAKKHRVKIILCYGNQTEMPAILHIAKKKGLSSEEGYQWNFLAENSWAFPFNNSFSCNKFPECTTVFGGSILFTETYNTSFMHTEHWERVLSYYYSVDKSIYLGSKSVYPNTDTSARMALGYDATWLYAQALTNLVSKSLTATTKLITKELRKVTIEGLSGTLKLNDHGDREGFRADIRIISATEVEQPMEIVAPLYKYIVTTPEGDNIEYVYDDGKNTHFTNKTILAPRLPVSPIYNIHEFKSKSGRLNKINFRLLKYDNETWPPRHMTRKEKTLPVFTCSHPCGLNFSESNVNVYDMGVCTSMNMCKCYDGYYGTYCENKVCKCSHGYCNIPYKCICYEGFTGDECETPICYDCVHGQCVEPFKCECYKNYWIGKYCDIHLAAILVPLFIIQAASIYLGYVFSIFIRKRIERATALSNLDWLVDWEEVILIDKHSSSTKSMTFASSTGNMSHASCTWKKRKWYLKKINSDTVDQDDIHMRLEMVELITLNHQNLITYGGACLVHPNVCFLVEPTQKGSLEDVLMNETINLDWNFRFSFLKDICRGMNFLHTKTNIGSHGHLKSSNCLLDNRWCIRITDFGAPTIRYGPYLIERTEDEKALEYNSMQESLIWTAPELLQAVACLDNVGIGTQEGDVYSFGIVVSEIATRDVPFAYERGYLSICALIDLIVNRDDPEVKTDLEIWESLETDSKVVRPYIHPDYLPEGKSAREKFLDMLDNAWHDDPLKRFTFQNLISVLDTIFPTKEELMDNLMHLLESYSKNLEKIVIERTDALEIEKSKVENIVSQMLPKKVIDELKKGNKIEPEDFKCVTVYYSDIVGFTSIAKSIQPMQVVDLLNDLYSLFDGILSQYDVYKVETIGDAYVVASGIPTLNDNLHAGEIATAAMDVMSAILTKEFTYLNHMKLQMRLGINTGPVVAGVVGLKMPRYTLFGETMQITATMESSSKAMHIQISEYTVKILKELGGYSLKYRGSMTVCGKNIETYWLTGKTGYNNPLPEVEEK